MDGTVTLRGRVGSDLVSLRSRTDTPGVRFRLGVTHRRRTDNGSYEDVSSQWFTVCAWGRLATFCLASLHKGDPVIAVGRPSGNAWTSNSGEVMAETVINAQLIGHDLNFGTTRYFKNGGEAPPLPAESRVSVSNEATPEGSPFRSDCVEHNGNESTDSQGVYHNHYDSQYDSTGEENQEVAPQQEEFLESA